MSQEVDLGISLKMSLECLLKCPLTRQDHDQTGTRLGPDRDQIGTRLMVQNWLNNTETNKKKGITEGSGKPPELPNYWVMGFCEKYSYTVAEVLLCGR